MATNYHYKCICIPTQEFYITAFIIRALIIENIYSFIMNAELIFMFPFLRMMTLEKIETEYHYY